MEPYSGQLFVVSVQSSREEMPDTYEFLGATAEASNVDATVLNLLTAASDEVSITSENLLKECRVLELERKLFSNRSLPRLL